MKGNILYICSDLPPLSTGYSNAFNNLLCAIQGYTIDVLTTTDNACLELNSSNDIMIYRCGKLSDIPFLGYFYNSFRLFLFYKKLIKAKNYDMIFIETFDDALFLSLIDKADYRKIVVRIHSTSETEYTYFFPGKKNKLNKFLQRNVISRKIINMCSTNNFHNDFMKKNMLKDDLYKISQKNFFVLPNTMTMSELTCLIPEKNIKQNNKIKFITLGRLNLEGFYQKGMLDFLYAISLLDDSIRDRAEFVFIGDGDLYEFCSSTIETLRLKDCVQQIRRIKHDELIVKLIDSDVVVLPSRFEGMSMFALEALYTKNICLFSQTGGLIDMIPNINYSFKPQDIEGLTKVISEIIELPIDRLEVEKSKSICFSERFSYNIVSDKFDKLFNIIAR